MKIYLSRKDMQHKRAISDAVDNLILRDVNFNGMEYKIIDDQDYTTITGVDEYTGMQVMALINGIWESD